MSAKGRYADLEITLHRRDGSGYSVELRFNQPDSEADVRLVRGGDARAEWSLDELAQLVLDDVAYGTRLGAGLLASDEMRLAFAQARAAAQSQDVPLRVRLVIGASAPELHGLRWELLHEPGLDTPLLTGEHLLFSRYLSSSDWRPVSLRPQGALRALVVVANPSNVTQYAPGGQPLAPIDVAGEIERARAALGEVAVTELAARGSATLDKLVTTLRDGYDILYLVCHGALIKGEPRLWLEDEAGTAAVVAGSDLVTRLQEMRERPRLVVLASCQSAGRGEEAKSADEGALAALGPRLAEAGIPAVLAMQGNVSMETIKVFMPRFFEALRRDGEVDHAVAVARGAVRERPDWWMPVLFMRLKSGRISYVPGFADEKGGMEKWPALLRHIERGRCTPILGSGLTESLLGSRQEIAQRWAEQYGFPLAPHDRESLPQVAQFLAVNQDYMFPRDELGEYLRGELRERYPNVLGGMEGATLDELLSTVVAARQATGAAEPHRVLASLSLPIFITTDPSSLLFDALRAAGKEPVAELCRWNEDTQFLPSIYDDEPNFRPTPERPLVFQLFGTLAEPNSLVLTEDDYFDFLIGVTNNKDLIPPMVRRWLADTALLFLGFRMDEWDFRVLFRSIMRQEGGQRRARYAHIAAQIDPEQGRILDPNRARRYLESYFQGADMSIFWGSAEDFVRELAGRLEQD